MSNEDIKNNENLQTDDELLEAAKKRLTEAREKASAAGTVEEVETWNNEIDAAKLDLENLINELTRQSGDDTADAENTASAEENEESKDTGFGGHTIILGGDYNHNDDNAFSPVENNGENNHIPSPTINNDNVENSKLQKELKETKKRLTKVNSELADLQEQHEALNTRHSDLKISLRQTNTSAIAEKKELQNKYDKALDTSKTLVAGIESLEKRLTETATAAEILKAECDSNIKQQKEAVEKELEKRRQELETTKGSNEQVRCDVIKLALAHLGHTAPENFKSDSFYSNILKLYDFIKKDLLTRYDWKFALEKKGLSPSDKIEGSYYFTYELPKNLLKIQKIVPNHDYEIMGNNLLCMADNIALYYIKYVEDVNLPEFFKTLMVYTLAASSAALVTQNEVIAKKWEIEANQRFCTAIANDTSQQAIHGVIRNPIYLAHFS